MRLTHIIIKTRCYLSVHASQMSLAGAQQCGALFTVAVTAHTLSAAMQHKCKLCRHYDVTIIEKKINFMQLIIDFINKCF